jgi:anti-sigma factor ChrR (cupin superfamily)
MHPNDTALNDYADGSLGPVERHGVEQHLAGCAACRQTVDDLREILEASQSLELREPPVRVWSRIERAIKLESGDGARRLQPGGVPAGPAQGGRYRVYVAWLAAAAALVLATVIGMRYTPSPASPDAARPAAAAPAGAVASSDPALSIEAELRQAESHYENAIKGLEAIANSEQAELDPRTAATLQKNLAVIDQAISESRAAVRAQPASEPAQQSLIEGFKTKIGLLQDTVALINEMRKGNEAGAARIASGLKQKGT